MSIIDRLAAIRESALRLRGSGQVRPEGDQAMSMLMGDIDAAEAEAASQGFGDDATALREELTIERSKREEAEKLRDVAIAARLEAQARYEELATRPDPAPL
jgi:hypothetical protein